MAVVYGAYTSYIPYLSSDFYVEERKAYDLDDPIIGPVVAEVMKRNPDAFRATPDPTPPAPPVVEQATAAPGEKRRTGKSGRG
jgi:hypothetical protein